MRGLSAVEVGWAVMNVWTVVGSRAGMMGCVALVCWLGFHGWSAVRSMVGRVASSAGVGNR